MIYFISSFSKTPIAICSLVIGSSLNQIPVALAIACASAGARSINYDLSDGFCSERSRRLKTAFKFHLDVSHISSGRDLVLHERIIQHGSFVIVLDVLIKRHANSLYQTTFGLYSCKIWIHYCSAVHNRFIIQYLHMTGLFVQFNLHSSCHEWRR